MGKDIKNQGFAVFADGKMVAWFADWNDAAVDWCRTHHYGKWFMTERVREPVFVPPTKEEIAKINRQAGKLYVTFRDNKQEGE